jgi:hypothetical protein
MLGANEGAGQQAQPGDGAPTSPTAILSKRSNRKTESGINRKTVRLSGRNKSRVVSGAVLMIAFAARVAFSFSDCQFAIDPETKIVPTFAVGDRSQYMANCFIEDLAARLFHRVQISTDALGVYEDAIERAFGSNVDYGSIIKTYGHTELAEQRR